MNKPLSPEACRHDLSDRECSTILGSVIGGLMQLSNIDSIRNAVRWWAETDAAWAQLEAITALCDKDAVKAMAAAGKEN